MTFLRGGRHQLIWFLHARSRPKHELATVGVIVVGRVVGAGGVKEGGEAHQQHSKLPVVYVVVGARHQRLHGRYHDDPFFPRSHGVK